MRSPRASVPARIGIAIDSAICRYSIRERSGSRMPPFCPLLTRADWYRCPSRRLAQMARHAGCAARVAGPLWLCTMRLDSYRPGRSHRSEHITVDFHTWLIYVVAITGLSLSPGPNGLLALTHGAVYGWRKATYTVLGGVSGFVVIIALSLFGIGALLEASVTWLTLMKYAGGAYLIWLGIQVWR